MLIQNCLSSLALAEIQMGFSRQNRSSAPIGLIGIRSQGQLKGIKRGLMVQCPPAAKPKKANSRAASARRLGVLKSWASLVKSAVARSLKPSSSNNLRYLVIEYERMWYP